MDKFIRHYDSKEKETSFTLKSSGKVVTRLATKLSRDDWEQMHALLGMVYRMGIQDGSEDRAKQIRTALGFSEANHDN